MFIQTCETVENIPPQKKNALNVVAIAGIWEGNSSTKLMMAMRGTCQVRTLGGVYHDCSQLKNLLVLQIGNFWE